MDTKHVAEVSSRNGWGRFLDTLNVGRWPFLPVHVAKTAQKTILKFTSSCITHGEAETCQLWNCAVFFWPVLCEDA